MSDSDILKNFRYQRRIYHANTDSAGVVYYGNYFIFFEEARAEWLRALGFHQAAIAREFDTHILVKRVHEMDFKKPALMDDLIDIDCQLLASSKVSFTIEQTAYNKSNDILVSAKIDLLCVDAKTGRPKRAPAALLERLS